MSASRKKMAVVATRKWRGSTTDKRWVVVKMLRSTTWVPSFEDIHRIVQAIALCEDEKYPNGKGRTMVAEFVKDAVFIKDFSVLRQKYRIPDRCAR